MLGVTPLDLPPFLPFSQIGALLALKVVIEKLTGRRLTTPSA